MAGLTDAQIERLAVNEWSQLPCKNFLALSPHQRQVLERHDPVYFVLVDRCLHSGSSPTGSAGHSSGPLSQGAQIGLGVGAGVGALGLLALAYCYCRRRRPKSGVDTDTLGSPMLGAIQA